MIRPRFITTAGTHRLTQHLLFYVGGERQQARRRYHELGFEHQQKEIATYDENACPRKRGETHSIEFDI